MNSTNKYNKKLFDRIDNYRNDILDFLRQNGHYHYSNEINLELGVNAIGGRITLGDAESTNPMVLGNQLEDLFEKLLSSLSSFSNSTSGATGVSEIADAGEILKKDIEDISINMLPQILSDTVYITENQINEVTSINEVEGEVEPIIQVAGVRG